VRRLPIAIVVLFALSTAACGEAGGDATADGPSKPRPSAGSQRQPTGHTATPAKAGTSVRLRTSDYGRILFGSGNRAIYLFDREESARSECYGPCAEAWPPVITEGKPRAADGVRTQLLRTISRRDGSRQVTYNGHPLYYYVNDAAGQVLCQGVTEFGGVWRVVDRAGDPVG
jgi:predicted lipoprotein with Yx(FWY)xxD motif